MATGYYARGGAHRRCDFGAQLPSPGPDLQQHAPHAPRSRPQNKKSRTHLRILRILRILRTSVLTAVLQSTPSSAHLRILRFSNMKPPFLR